MKNQRFIILRLFVLIILFACAGFGNTVTLDSSFNGTGFNIQPAAPPPARSFAASSVVQADGKIILGGYTKRINEEYDKFAMMRLNADGTLDTSFGGGSGTVLTAIGTSGYGAEILIQADGKILLGGASATEAASFDFTIVRYNADGSLDTTFNNTGYVRQGFTNLSPDHVANMTLQPDGKIVMVGHTTFPFGQFQHSDLAVMRFNSDGSLDSTFNGGGKFTFNQQNFSESANSVIVQPDGKILVGGTRFNGVLLTFLIIRLNANGTIDTSFGSEGIIDASPFPGSNDGVRSLALQSDGKILASGFTSVTRFLTNGTRDALIPRRTR